MKAVCDHCREIRDASNYKAVRKDGVEIKIQLCDQCLGDYLSLSESDFFNTTKGYVKDVSLDMADSGGSSYRHENAGNHKSEIHVYEKNVWTNIVKIMCFVFAGLLVLAGGIAGAVLLGGATGDLIFGLCGFLLGIIVGGIIGMMNVAVLMMFVEISQNLATLVRKSNYK